MVVNKVGFVINCVNAYVENHWENMGVVYLSFQLDEGHSPPVEAILKFIEECASTGQSCLIHSVNGQSRACALAAIYLMRKYGVCVVLIYKVQMESV